MTYRNDCELEVIYDDIFRKNVYFFEANTSEPFIIDCGGHIGLAVLYFKSLCPQARILSFEPNPETFALLQKNIVQNNLRGVEAINMALRATTRPTQFSMSERISAGMGFDRHNRTQPLGQHARVSRDSGAIDRFSSYISERVDFLKLDIEGAEVAVLDELNGKLSAVAALTLEYHQNPANLAERKLQEIVEKLSRSGFRMRFSTKRSLLVSTDCPAIRFINLLFGQPDEVLTRVLIKPSAAFDTARHSFAPFFLNRRDAQPELGIRRSRSDAGP